MLNQVTDVKAPPWVVPQVQCSEWLLGVLGWDSAGAESQASRPRRVWCCSSCSKRHQTDGCKAVGRWTQGSSCAELSRWVLWQGLPSPHTQAVLGQWQVQGPWAGWLVGRSQ